MSRHQKDNRDLRTAGGYHRRSVSVLECICGSEGLVCMICSSSILNPVASLGSNLDMDLTVLGRVKW